MNDNPTIVDWEIEATCDLAVQLVAGCFAGPPDGRPPVLLAVQVGTWASATLQAGEAMSAISVLAFHQQIERRDLQSNIGPEVPGVEGHLGAIFSR